ncbi:hypothetical protein JAAARDRAFT_134918 [Jaapia argillacea MUCL 33604]|uniref:RING-type E3 ubiquitin transferase n=1 Tax=Jaapia argillacea MUCL 33604 TaxID=933084 RepID=A0A067PLV5_9AGAM|nr:hypothetical protein JAAARDRAFT_134918 [Jaapia argillacea MUCL 33604]
MSLALPSFPQAQQAQIIRANQRDLFHVASLREQTESILRSWLGTRWLTRWDKEIEVLVKLAYNGLTTGLATQTLGEEYTDIWQHSARVRKFPPLYMRAALILLSTMPGYFLSRWHSANPSPSSRLTTLLHAVPTALEVISEINLAIFYLRGTYYDLSKRLLGIRHISSIPEDPHTRPPSYALLGVLLGVRLIHRLVTFLRERSAKSRAASSASGKTRQSLDAVKETFLDDRPVSSLLGPVDPEGKPAIPAEEDERTYLDVTAIPSTLRASRSCTLCLEERTASCATDCGHLFCWDCIYGWGREKAECPLCRQALSLSRLLPIYNL